MTAQDHDDDRPVPTAEPAITSARLTEHNALLHQAAGFVGAGLHISPDDALVVLDREAREQGLDVAQLARDILDRRRSLPSLD
ncbi:hypothetical protein GRS96_19600 (plasmid) [Rathayibacter sp. VKM Ac-2803]|uniref:ANTAR domain-containing protein n=1 Tax=Rathayibacter caricis DSM 15933 TaxID=1328867 RepID=A0A2T4UP53_9MICO|nr:MULTISPECIES: hypothetical protein [Rathayibacter]MWV51474.1 hypothetical protein [Rathayibacter sp. VKM Ac-2803]PTL71299.1 hypothetical protein C1I63_18925 [Rathayibacter caricis DSM 15933]